MAREVDGYVMDALLELSRLSADGLDAGALRDQVARVVGYFGELEKYGAGEDPYAAYPSTEAERLRGNAAVPGIAPGDVRRISVEFLDGYLRVPKVL